MKNSFVYLVTFLKFLIATRPTNSIYSVDSRFSVFKSRCRKSYGNQALAIEDPNIACQDEADIFTIKEQEEREKIEQIKSIILESLDLKSPPNITRRAHKPPKLLLDQYDRQTNKRRKSEKIPNKKVFSIAQRVPLPGISGFYFNISIKNKRYNVVNAMLWLYIQSPVNQSSVQILISRYERTTNGTIYSVFVKNKRVKLDNYGNSVNCYKISVNEIVQSWISGQSRNFGISIECLKHPKIIPSYWDAEEQNMKPFLEIELKKVTQNRSKRSPVPITTCQEGDLKCCKHEFHVDFRLMEGWQFIVKPVQFTFSYCAGDCHLGLLGYNYQKFSHNIPLKNEACCSPSEILPMEILYHMNDFEIGLRQINHMLVEQCKCA